MNLPEVQLECQSAAGKLVLSLFFVQLLQQGKEDLSF
jgi:hypothetical protein